MIASEANAIIENYMCGKSMRYDEEAKGAVFIRYSDSLDALVPVWEKLKVTNSFQSITSGDSPWFFEIEEIDNEVVSDFEGWEKTLQEAAAIATAKAIQEIDNENDNDAT